MLDLIYDYLVAFALGMVLGAILTIAVLGFLGMLGIPL